MKRRVKIKASADKNENFSLAKQLGIVPGSQAERTFAETALDVTLVFDVDVNSGKTNLVGVALEPLGEYL